MTLVNLLITFLTLYHTSQTFDNEKSLLEAEIQIQVVDGSTFRTRPNVFAFKVNLLNRLVCIFTPGCKEIFSIGKKHFRCTRHQQTEDELVYSHQVKASQVVGLCV